MSGSARMPARGRTALLVVLLLALGVAVAACGGSGPAGTPGPNAGSSASGAPGSAAAGSAGPGSAPPGSATTGSAAPSGSGGAIASPSAATSPAGPPTSPVDGVVINVKSAGLAKVESFTIRTAAGEVLTFQVGQLAPGSFPAGHLTEHASTGAPVQVTFTVDGDLLIATNLADAP
jgi:hypothetical protein